MASPRPPLAPPRESQKIASPINQRGSASLRLSVEASLPQALTAEGPVFVSVKVKAGKEGLISR